MSTPNEKCEECGSEVTEPGSLTAAQGIMFRPQLGGFSPTERLTCVACLDCGHIGRLRLAALDLRGLRNAHDAGTLKPRMFD